MGGDQHGNTDLIESAQHLHYFVRVGGIQAGRGLVGEHDGRPIHHRAGDAQALLLTSRQGDRIGSFEPEQADLVECGACAPRGFAVGLSRDDQRQHDIVKHAPVVEQLLPLKHQPQIAPQVRDCSGAHRRHVLAVDEHRAAVGPLDCGDELEQRRLTRTRMPGQEQHLAGIDGEAHCLERLESARVALADLAEGNDGHADRLVEESRSELARGERTQIVYSLADAQKPKRQGLSPGPPGLRDRAYHAASCGTVKLGHDKAC
jgi:hypothetical protein